jgi:glycosyltransferase involved in cell wall biosynthesis
MTLPLLTIVTVTKNCVTSLNATLDTVKAIKNRDVEYIIIDGASTDGTLELIRNSGEMVDKLISEPDSGIYNAMNKGLDLAVGKYTLFINGDDQLLPEGFPIIWPLLKDGNARVISAKTRLMNDGKLAPTLVAIPWQLLFFNTIPHPSTFVLTTLLKRYRFREDLRIASDYDLFLRLLLDGNRFVKVNAITALHHRGGMSANSALSLQEMDQIRLDRLGKVRYQFLSLSWKVYRKAKSFFHVSKK